MWRWDHPRIRGEHRDSRRPERRVRGSSPHTRGALRQHHVDPVRSGIIPAYAGSTTLRTSCTTGIWDHPRIRGEHDLQPVRDLFKPGSSPHTRGAPVVAGFGLVPGGIIPAYAGSTMGCPCRSIRRRDHPRIRGEHDGSSHRLTLRTGSSPHTRGALVYTMSLVVCSGIIPAYAGSTVSGLYKMHAKRDHPRIRGEHREIPFTERLLPGSSPHTRGAPLPVRRGARQRGIIPAYAGSTFSSLIYSSFGRDHPRIRGEHLYFEGIEADLSGSSPHTRGAPAGTGPIYAR